MEVPHFKTTISILSQVDIIDQSPHLSHLAHKLITCFHEVLYKTTGASFHSVTEKASSICH